MPAAPVPASAPDICAEPPLPAAEALPGMPADIDTVAAAPAGIALLEPAAPTAVEPPVVMEGAGEPPLVAAGMPALDAAGAVPAAV